MSTSSHAQRVSDYYDASTEPFYIGPNGWDSEHIHFGLFTDRNEAEYLANPLLVMEDRKPAIARMHDAILAPANFKPTDVVVDAGCGVGGVSFLVNQKYGSNVVGLNINQLQIDIARERAKEAGVEDQVTFQLADCSKSLPLDDNSVDVILNIESACHYEDRSSFIAECARILKPGGMIVAQDWMEANGITEEQRAQFVQPVCDAWVMQSLDSLDGYREILTANGLEMTESEYMDGLRPIAVMMMARTMQLTQMLQQGEQISEYERGTLMRAKSFAEGFLGDIVQIGRYAAVKK